MSNQYVLVLIMGSTFLAALFFLFRLTMLVRSVLFHSSQKVLTFLVAVEYILLGYCLFGIHYPSYQLSRDSLYHKLCTNRVMFDDSLYSILIITFLLISITAFNTTKETFKQSVRSYVLFFVLSIVVVVILFLANDYIYQEVKKHFQFSGNYAKHLIENIIFSIPGLLWVYFLSRFKNRVSFSICQKLIYNYLPVVLLYLLIAFTLIKPFLINKRETEHLLNVLGAYG